MSYDLPVQGPYCKIFYSTYHPFPDFLLDLLGLVKDIFQIDGVERGVPEETVESESVAFFQIIFSILDESTVVRYAGQ